eukprot:TRINITY_DN3520_c0_g1_i2.p1 TRINITY_DN3520_c0_g1~~TRINITY_DN3520_c0_g1_i2.p1  ORF type:complete len:521 (-),score=82.23 TRINITY_DN3520_c0_g1_i2:47-1609(-)
MLVVFLFTLFLSSMAMPSKEGHTDSSTGTRTSHRAQFDVGSWKPKNWRLIPRTHVQPLEFSKAPRDLKPDDYFKFIPEYVGSVLPGQPFNWTTSCFKQNTATITIDGNSSATLTVSTTGKSSLLCDDTYLFGYIGSFDVTFFESPYWTHDIEWAGGWSEADAFDLETNGIRIFRFPDGVTASAEEVFETVLLFFGGLIGAHVPEWTAEDNLKFLADHMDVTLPPRKINRVDIPKSEIKSGDFFGVLRLDGLDPMLAWGMGSHTGHTTIALWVGSELYICESTVNSAYWPYNGIQMTPFDEWMDLAEKASYNVIHLPLSPEVAKKFDEAAAYKFMMEVKGLPYGFHNLFTGWIDTAEDNYPPPLSSHLVLLLAPFGEWLLSTELQLDETFDFITQALNFRLGTKGLSMGEAYMTAQKKGISLTELAAMPEQDSWIFENGAGFKNGPSMVCNVFVTKMWKAAGIFGSLTDSFQATEFTNWDAYTLNIFDGNYTRPKQCQEADPDSQFCQILGMSSLVSQASI